MHMKAVAVLTVLVVGSHLPETLAAGQSLTSAEAVEKINRVAQLAVGKTKSNRFESVSFTGGTFSQTERWIGDTEGARIVSVDIKWETFKTLTVTTSDGWSEATFYFDSKHTTQLVFLEDREKPQAAKANSHFTISIPPGNADAIAELKTASARLAELAKKGEFKPVSDKSLIVEKKAVPGPTKEQTLEFINATFKNPREFVSYGNDKGRLAISNARAVADDCTIKITYDEENIYGSVTLPGGKRSHTVDMEEVIEIVSAGYSPPRPKGVVIWGFSFLESEEDRSSSRLYLPFRASENFQDFKDLQVYKALNQLRKHCDAPEPVHFE
jgi:hypothetical protein